MNIHSGLFTGADYTFTVSSTRVAYYCEASDSLKGPRKAVMHAVLAGPKIILQFNTSPEEADSNRS